MGSYTPPVTDNTHYVTVQEATRLGYGADSTLRLWIRQGKLPAVKIGGRVKILRSDLDALAQPRRTQCAADEVDRAITQIVSQAPALSPTQLDRLRGVLGGAAA